MKSIWEYEDYRDWLRGALERRGHGSQSALAAVIPCQASYITKVLKGEADFSVEQGEATARFFQLDEDESETMLWLVLRSRAGTASLKKMFTEKLKAVREKQLDAFRGVPTKGDLKTRERYQIDDLMVYYSHWYYAAAHLLMTMEGEHTVESLSHGLQVSKGALQVMMKHLEKMGVVEFKDGSYRATENEIFLNASETTLKKWQLSWRTRLLQTLDTPPMQGDFHHTYAISCDHEDVIAIRNALGEAVRKIIDIARDAKPKQAVVVYLDVTPLILADREKWGGEDPAKAP